MLFIRELLPGRFPGEAISEFHDLQEVHAMFSETVKSWPAQWQCVNGRVGFAAGKLPFFSVNESTYKFSKGIQPLPEFKSNSFKIAWWEPLFAVGSNFFDRRMQK